MPGGVRKDEEKLVEKEGSLPATSARKRKGEEELVEKEGFVISDCLSTEKRDEKGPLPATQKRKLKDAEGLVEKQGAVIADSCSFPEKCDEEEQSEAANSEDEYRSSDEESDAPISEYDYPLRDLDEDPELFSRSYWVEQEKQGRILELPSFICRAKVKKNSGVVQFVHPLKYKAGGVIPLDIDYGKEEELRTLIDGLAREAIQKYSSKNGEAYKFHRIVNLNSSLSFGTTYYITFEAEGSDGIQTFEAKAFVGYAGERTIYFCRPECRTLKEELMEEMSKIPVIKRRA